MEIDYAYARLLIYAFYGMDFVMTLPNKHLHRRVIKCRGGGGTGPSYMTNSGYRYFYVMPFGRFVEL